MTKEELEKEAEKHADGIYHYKINVSDYGEDGIINYRYSDVKEAYQKGAEPREKQIAELEKENAELKSRDCWKGCLYASGKSELIHEFLQQKYNLTKAKKIMNIAIEGIKHWGIVGGTERPFEKQAELEFNLFLEKAEQFLKDSEKEC
jgi:hypothetical protein